MHLGFAQLTLLTAAYAAKSSICLSALCLRMTKPLCKPACAEFLPFSAAWLNSYGKEVTVERKKYLRKCRFRDILIEQRLPEEVTARASTGFDGGLAAGEAIRRRCVKSQT